MELNADFSQRVVVPGATGPGTPARWGGVAGRLRARLGVAGARPTSIVRYAPASHFSPHTHGGGEEFLVLDGVFQDEHGDYPTGSYIRNPPTSAHKPGSAPGCTIFVKLWQFDPADRTQIVIDTAKRSFAASNRPGVEIMPLFADKAEDVRLERWASNAAIDLGLKGGGEFLVLEGSFSEGGEDLQRDSWLRLPAGGRLRAKAGAGGCKLWVKTGHLAVAPTAPKA